MECKSKRGAGEKERGIKEAVKLVVACVGGSEMFETVSGSVEVGVVRVEVDATRRDFLWNHGLGVSLS